MTLRIGILGAARIAPLAVVRPARAVDGVEVAAVAARDPERARRFATKHGIPTVHAGYDALVDDDAIDAVYNPLPNGLHGRWTRRALAAGKHVLCEKPFTANATEAEEVAAAAAETDRVVMEAFHYRYHPLAQRVRDLVDAGAIGQVRRVATAMCIPLPLLSDIRYDLALAGGAVMDVGCYALHMQRHLVGAEPDVLDASAKTIRPGVDRFARARLRFPGRAEGTMTCALLSGRLLDVSARIDGDAGSIRVLNPTGPHWFHRLSVRTSSATFRERLGGEATYVHQLRAFARAVAGDRAANLTPPADSVATMRLVDATYRAAGLPVREPTSQ